MKIEARLPFEKVRADQDTDTHLVLSLTAPSLPTDVVRPKLAMTICVDTSSSMAGQKIEYARLSILKLIDHLKPDDYLGIVAFAAEATTIAPLTQLVTGKKDEMRKLVSNLRASGNTNFSGGMLSAIDMLKNADLGGSYIHRIIMFTDGQANAGPATKGSDIIRFFKANAPEYITASAFGYGRGVNDFDAAFLTEFAREAKGNYAHVEDPDNALKAFGTELGGLISMYATNIRLVVTPLAGHKITRVVSDVDADEEITGDVSIKVPDILAEETRNLVLSVNLAHQKSSGPRPVNVFSVKAFYDVFDVTGKKETKCLEAKGKIQFVKEGEEQKTSNTEVADIVGLAQLVRAQLDAEAQAKQGNFAAASAVMDSAIADFEGQGNVRLASLSKGVRHRLADAGSYASNQGYLRGFAGGVTRGMGGASYSAEVTDDLNALGVQMSNSYQVTTSDSFTGGVSHVPAPGTASVSSILNHTGVPDAASSVRQDAILAAIQAVQAPVPTHETASGGKSKDKSPPAKKRVKQTRSNKNW